MTHLILLWILAQAPARPTIANLDAPIAAYVPDPTLGYAASPILTHATVNGVPDVVVFYAAAEQPALAGYGIPVAFGERPPRKGIVYNPPPNPPHRSPAPAPRGSRRK